MNEQNIINLQKKLGYVFEDPELLKTALTHSSYANENKKSGAISNERLEFLGDSVLGMTVAAVIYDNNPDMPEGLMTRLRAELVCEKSLASVALMLDLGDCLLLGHGEVKSGGRERPSILADAVEAVLAAVYLEGGFEPVERIVLELLGNRASISFFENTDYKTSLQEIIQEKAGQTLNYRVTDESGPDHMKTYTVEVFINNSFVGRGTGKSKKEAEQEAARVALMEISG
jgi:ribonuclease-3